MHPGENFDLEALNENIDEIKYYRESHNNIKPSDSIRLDRALLRLRKLKHEINNPRSKVSDSNLLWEVKDINRSLSGLGLHLNDCQIKVGVVGSLLSKIIGK